MASTPLPPPAPDRRRAPRLTRIGAAADRRQWPRFTLPAGYTAIKVRRMDSPNFDIEGFADVISEGGVRFELDEPVAPGNPIEMQLRLPGLQESAYGPGRAVYVFANVVWLEDEDEPGPVKMAAVFTRYASAEDEAR